MGVRIRKALATVAIVATVATLAGGCSTAGDTGNDAPGDTDNTAAGGASTTAAAATTTDYRALPLEQRPEVFNPCEEITIAELEAAGFRDITPDPAHERHPANSRAHMCAWDAYPMGLTAAGSWSNPDDIRQNDRFEIVEETKIGDFNAIVFLPKQLKRNRICHVLIDTDLGEIALGGHRTIPPSDPTFNQFDVCNFLLGFADSVISNMEGK